MDFGSVGDICGLWFEMALWCFENHSMFVVFSQCCVECLCLDCIRFWIWFMLNNKTKKLSPSEPK